MTDTSLVQPDMSPKRVGLIVPSSNITMEIEIPEMLRNCTSGEVSFHSARMALRQVSEEELRAMNSRALQSVDELADARVDVIAYACLVAVMVQGTGAHRDIEARLRERLAARGSETPVVSSAGALVSTLKYLQAQRIAIVAPYLKPLTQTVAEYLEAESFTVQSTQSLEISDNFEVGCIPGERVLQAAGDLDLEGVDALVLSACVQMPSLSLIEEAEEMVGIPVISASTSTAAALLSALGLDPIQVPGGAGRAWAGKDRLATPA
jgi:maleate isomerase